MAESKLSLDSGVRNPVVEVFQEARECNHIFGAGDMSLALTKYTVPRGD